MVGFGSEVLVSDVLWFLVIVGWIVLIVIGLEADKPLSGGLPSHSDTGDTDVAEHLTSADRAGVIGAWVLFGVMACSLPVILYWIFQVHGQ